MDGSPLPSPVFSHIISMKTYYAAAFTLLVYDYCLTFSEEVELAWGSRKTFVSVLFFLNRYISLIFAIIVSISYFSPAWTFTICGNYVVAEFVFTVLIYTVAEVFLALRIYILTHKNLYLISFFAIHILAQLVLGFYIMSIGGNAGQPLPNIEGTIDPHIFQMCALVPNAKSGPLLFRLLVAYLSMILSFNTTIFVITLIVTVAATRTSPSRQWLQVMQRDGVMYFIVIFTATALWLIFAIRLPDYLQLINIVPAHIFTAIMVNRLYLSLKKVGQKVAQGQEQVPHAGEAGKTNAAPFELQVIVSRHTTTVLSDRHVRSLYVGN